MRTPDQHHDLAAYLLEALDAFYRGTLRSPTHFLRRLDGLNDKPLDRGY